MGHVPIYSDPSPIGLAAAPRPGAIAGECRYCGRWFWYGDRTDCISCGALLPLEQKRQTAERPQFDNYPMYGASAGYVIRSASCATFG